MSMKISLLINMKMPTNAGIFIFISKVIFMLSYVKQDKMKILVIRALSAWNIWWSVELSMEKSFITLGSDRCCSVMGV